VGSDSTIPLVALQTSVGTLFPGAYDEKRNYSWSCVVCRYCIQ